MNATLWLFREEEEEVGMWLRLWERVLREGRMWSGKGIGNGGCFSV